MKNNYLRTKFFTNYFAKNNSLLTLLLVSMLILIPIKGLSQSNNCAATPTLTIGTTCVTTNYNVANGTFTDSGVAESCTGTSYRDGWFTFTTDATTTLISIDATSNRKLGLALYSGACGSLSEVTCTIPNTANASLTNISVSASTTYRLRLMRTNNAGTNDMTGTVCITKLTPPSSNFTCATATSLPCATTNLAGTTVGSSNTAHGTACTMSNYGAWYNFVGDGQQTTISSTAAFDHEMSISSGSCGTFTNLACRDSGLSGGTETYTFTTSAGVNYYVFISHYDSSSTTTGTFTISRSCTAAPIPPANDNCAGAIALTVNPDLSCGTVTAGTVLAATNSGVASGCSGTADDDVWYSFVATSTAHQVSLLNVAGSATDMYHAVYSGASGCGALGAALVCSDNNTSTIGGLTIGQTYYVQVYTYTSTTGQTSTFDICIGTPPPPPANDNCAGAIALTVNPDLSCGTVTAGSVAAATNSGVASSCFGTDDDDVWFSFVATNTTHQVSLLNVAGSTTDMYHAVYSGASGCGSLGAALICSDNNTSTIGGLTIGQTYYVQVYTYTSTTGQTSTFDICVGTTCNGSGPGTGTTTLGCPTVISGGLGLSGADPAAVSCTAASTCVDLEATYLDLGDTSTYTVQSIAYAPPYQFDCLANAVSVNDDDVWSPTINLPFNFCFYGNNYNQCLIGSNGVLTFDTTNNTAGGYCSYSFNADIPVAGDSALVENAIFGVFQDINPRIAGEVGWELITLNTGCRALVAAWNQIPLYGDNSKINSCMMVLYENTNVIEVYIKKKTLDNTDGDPFNDNNAVVGIQNADGSIASVAPGRNGLSANWTATNEAWRFVPSGTSITSLAWHEGSGTSGPVIGTTDVINVCPTSTTTYTAEITYTLCNGTTLIETEETTVKINGSKVWDGSVDTNWNDTNNWTPVGVPTATDCVVIPNTANDPIISGASYDAFGLNLTIENSAVLTVNATNDLIINDWVNINAGGDLKLNDDASLIQVNNNPNTGTMHMDRTVNICKLDYVYWSSPVTSFASSAISPGTSAGYIYKWTPTIGSNTNGFGNWALGNENMVVGKGYIVRGPDAYTTTAAPFTATFTGTPTNGVITTPILRGTWNGGTYATGVSTTLGTNYDDNWNLIGNPYPSAVNAIGFLTANTNIDGFVKIWTHGTLPSTAIADPFYNNYVYNYTPGDYITYNSSGTSSGPGVFGGYIASGQGFFVSMLHTSGSTAENVTFNNSMRNTSNSNSQFFRNSSESNPTNDGRIWLDLIDSNGSMIRNLVGYIDGATNNRDRLFDAITDEKLNFNFYSQIGAAPMTIQGRTVPFDQYDLVPMGIKVPQNGNYAIAIGAVDGFFTNTSQNIYLEDVDTNIIHDLRQNPYNFTANAGDDSDRFILRFTNNTLGNEDINNDEANVWAITTDHLAVKSTKNTIQSVRVFDVLGRLLADYQNVNEYEVPVTTIQKNNVALIIQVTLSNGTTVNKKVIF